MSEYEQEYFKDRPMEQKYWLMSKIWEDYFDLDENSSVFDYGAGLGYYIHCLRYYGIDRCWGYEVSKHAVNSSYGLARGRISNEIREGKYDLVLCIDVLEHLTLEEIESTIEKLINLSGKYILCSICCMNDPNFPLDPTHKTKRTYRWWRHQFEKRGCKWTPTPDYFMFPHQFFVFEVDKNKARVR